MIGVETGETTIWLRISIITGTILGMIKIRV